MNQTFNYTSVSKFSQTPTYNASIDTIDTTNLPPSGDYSFISANNRGFNSESFKNFIKTPINQQQNSYLTTNFISVYNTQKDSIISKLNTDLRTAHENYQVNSLPDLLDTNTAFTDFINTYNRNLIDEIGSNTFEPDTSVYLTIKIQFLNKDGVNYTSPYLLSLKFIIEAIDN